MLSGLQNKFCARNRFEHHQHLDSTDIKVNKLPKGENGSWSMDA